MNDRRVSHRPRARRNASAARDAALFGRTSAAAEGAAPGARVPAHRTCGPPPAAAKAAQAAPGQTLTRASKPGEHVICPAPHLRCGRYTCRATRASNARETRALCGGPRQGRRVWGLRCGHRPDAGTSLRAGCMQRLAECMQRLAKSGTNMAAWRSCVGVHKHLLHSGDSVHYWQHAGPSKLDRGRRRMPAPCGVPRGDQLSCWCTSWLLPSCAAYIAYDHGAYEAGCSTLY